MKKIIFFLLILIGCENNTTSNHNGLNTKNVILITLDGVRWQEVFQGADKRIILNNIKDDTKIEKKSSYAFFMEYYCYKRTGLRK
jgi:hypothetical protein